jgi:hypothetical protein
VNSWKIVNVMLIVDLDDRNYRNQLIEGLRKVDGVRAIKIKDMEDVVTNFKNEELKVEKVKSKSLKN